MCLRVVRPSGLVHDHDRAKKTEQCFWVHTIFRSARYMWDLSLGFMNIFSLTYFTESLKGKGRCKEPELKRHKINDLTGTHRPKLHCASLTAAETLNCQCSSVMSFLSAAIHLRNISSCCSLNCGLPLPDYKFSLDEPFLAIYYEPLSSYHQQT
jgi:hypothetical protein